MNLDRKKVTLLLKEDLKENIKKFDLEYIKRLYKIEYISDINNVIYIIDNIINKNNRKIIKYCDKAKDTFSIERYERYLDWRIENKSVSNTEEFYKLVYGDNWEIYFKAKKISRHYEPEYIMNRDNCSYDDAVETINKMKKDKVTSLDGFIKRHGDIKGREMFDKFRKTSNIFDKDNLIRIYGIDKYESVYEKNFRNVRENSPWCNEFWEKRGYSGEDVRNKISEYQRLNSGVSKDAIISRNKGDLEYSDYIYSKINKKKDSKSFSHCLRLSNYNYLDANILYEKKRKYSDHRSLSNFKSIEEYIEYNNKISDKNYNTLLNNNRTYDRSLRTDFKKYCKIVNYYTKLNLKIYGFEKFGFDYKDKIGKYMNHIDHIFSKFDGFINDVDPKIIGSIDNLQTLNYLVNIKKNKKSWIELDDLYSKYENSKYTKI